MHPFINPKPIPQNILQQVGLTYNDTQKIIETENNALTMCGGLLGDCYIMTEIIAWLLYPHNNIMQTIKAQSWYKQSIKKNINTSYKTLMSTLSKCKDNSRTGIDYMEDTADGIYFEIKDDLFKLHNSISNELGKTLKQPNAVAYLLLIDMLYSWITARYDMIIEHMKTIYCPKSIPDFYDSWYSHARCTQPATYWQKAIEAFDKQYIHDIIDLNKADNIKLGFTIINNKLNNLEIAKKARLQAESINGEDASIQEFDEACKFMHSDIIAC